MFQLLFARGSFKLSANTPAPTPLPQEPPRKGSFDLFPIGILFFMRHGSRWVFSQLLAAFMKVLFFADHLDRQGGKSLLSLCSDPWPVSPGHLAMREKRRGNQCSNYCSRASRSVKARTRPPWRCSSTSRRAKEAPTCPRFSHFRCRFWHL